MRANPWQLIIRLPHQLEEEFGFSRELLLLVTGWADFRVSDLEQVRTLVRATPRVEPEAAAFVGDDPRTADKAYEWGGNDFTLFVLTHDQVASAVEAGRSPSIQCLREALQAGLFGRNFYDESGPVTGERFFGRSTLLNQIRSDFVHHRTVGLFGLRKIGKTSLIQQALQRLEPGEIGVYVDLGGERIHKDARHILVTLVERVSRTLSGPEVPSVRWAESPDRFTSSILEWLQRVLGELQERNLRFILALDEIEAILPTAESAGLPYWEDMLGAFRSLWQGHSSFQLIFAGVNPAVFERPSIGDRDNPVFAFARPTYVKCMSQPEMARMVTTLGKRTGIAWPGEVLDRLYIETGGHPYLSRQVCVVVVAGLAPPDTVTLPLLEQRLGEVLLMRQDVFHEIFDSLSRHFPEELATLQRVAKDGRVRASDLQASELGHLLGYELLSLNSGFVEQRVGLLARWLRQT